ncbi:MAG: hypothetical protein QOC59_148, partial [Microbacteriaceae bacterium]|nr:hypothetical protein [Microbacteriaceae bacterium]
MVTRPRWRRIVALAASSSLLASLAVGVPLSAQADTAPATPSTPTTVSSDSLPTAQVDGVVWSQIIVGNTVYVGGEFTQAQPAGAAAGVGAVTRTDMLAYNLTTGDLLPFAPTFNAQVRGLAASPDGRTIYAVGNFTQVNGINRYRVVALDAVTGAVRTAFTAQTNAAVYTVAATATTVYLGGTFTIADNVARTRAAAVDATTGALTGWAPQIPDHRVQAMVLSPDGSKIVLGGSFLSLNGSTSPGRGLGAGDPVSGATQPWNAG